MERILLLVDDEPNILKALKRLLRWDGYRILSATSAEEGLNLLERHKVNVIISDQRMPQMTGVEFLSRVRERYPDTVRIILSAYSDFSVASSAINEGAIYKFFTKPWDGELMRNNVREAFHHSELNHKNEQLIRIFESTQEGIMITDINGVIQSVNPAFTAITGYPAAEAIGRASNLLRSEHHDREYFKEMWRTLGETGQWQGEIWNRRKNGECYPQWLSITAIRNDAGVTKQYVGLFNDITAQKKTEAQIRHQACHDMLTGLPNRQLFNERLELALAEAQRSRKKLAIMFIDLDRFKNINDSLGHAAGDQLLQGMARRLRECTREKDMVARMGGDEFTVMLPCLGQEHEAEGVAQKILESFSQPLQVEGHELIVTASIGISFFPHDGRQPELLMKNADSAMYSAKEQGKNKYCFYSAEMNARAMEHFTLESSLRHALEREEFLLHYQPQVAVANGQLTGFEVLLRWTHPKLGMVPPGKFISLLEETGLIIPVGEWVLRKACQQNQAWRTAGFSPLRVAVNFSSHQFRDAEVDKVVAKVLRDSGLSPDGLEIEITESVVMDQVEQSIGILQALRAMGVAVAIDDFGTGYSSLSYLKQFSVDSLKIDQSFIRDINCNPQDMEIVTSIIAMAHRLELQVIAEGVETQEQMVLLQELNCDQIQGYYIAHPLEASQATDLLKKSMYEPLYIVN